MQKILRAIRMGNSIGIPLKTFGIEKGKAYLVRKVGEDVLIREAKE